MAQFNITGGLTQGQTGGELGNNPPQFSGSVQIGCGAGSEGGTTDYNLLFNKPKINSVELIGDKSISELGIEPAKGTDDNFVTDTEKAAIEDLVTDYAAGKVLSDKNFTDAEKTQGAIVTGVVNPSPIGAKDISTVKKLADAFDKASTCLLRTISVPTNTSSVVINTTDNGVAFADLNINQINISISGILQSDTVTNCFIGVNGLYSEPISNYYQLGTGTQPSGFLNIIRKYFSIHGVITATNGDASAIFSSWRSTALNPTSNVASVVQGGVKFGNVGGKITEVRIIVSGANFDAGTTIKLTKIC